MQSCGHFGAWNYNRQFSEEIQRLLAITPTLYELGLKSKKQQK
jgi:hypothetical protein